MQTLDTEKLVKLKQAGEDFTLINVLDPEAFEQQHIPGSINIPVSSDDFVSDVADAAGSKDAPIVVYCANEECSASPTAAEQLDQAGFSNVFDYEGGNAAWREAGHELVSGAAAG